MGRGTGTIFFFGGGGRAKMLICLVIDMPSDCQNLGGHRHIHPLETKSGGGGSRAPVYGVFYFTFVTKTVCAGGHKRFNLSSGNIKHGRMTATLVIGLIYNHFVSPLIS